MCKVNILKCNVNSHNHILDKNLILCIKRQRGSTCIDNYKKDEDKYIRVLDNKTADITLSPQNNIINVDCTYVPQNIVELKYDSEKVDKLYNK